MREVSPRLTLTCLKPAETEFASEDGLEAQERSRESRHTRWIPLVRRIEAGDDDATLELYEIFNRGMRFMILRQLGQQDLGDKVHDVFLTVIQAIRRGELREPERLMGFVHTILRRRIATYIEEVVIRRRTESGSSEGLRTHQTPQVARTPEHEMLAQEQQELVRSVLRRMSARDREILTRFYLDEQPQEQICQEMGLSETQFRLLKSRAKVRFGELGKRRLDRGSRHVDTRATSRP